MTFFKRCLAGLLSAFLVLASVGCAHDTSLGQKVDDTTVTTKVKTALLADPDVSGTAISVETLNGRVQLSGFVDSDAQARRAVDLASRVEGVKGVDNKMSVKK
jgi:hyperosmotically inducible protein